MIPLTFIYQITRKIGAITEIMKKIGDNIEYTLVPTSCLNGRMIDKSIVEKKKDFFRKVNSLKRG